MENDDMVWQFVLRMLPTWKGTDKELFDTAYRFVYNYRLFRSGDYQ